MIKMLPIYFYAENFFSDFVFFSLVPSTHKHARAYADSKTQRTHGRQAQLGNISAARAVADIIRSTLGPRSMLKVRGYLACKHAHL
jgi:hypothetical protein